MPRWDIFCRVVDNYGDIAVTWRLARQLVAEHGINVRLWVDDLCPLAALCPQADPFAPIQILNGVEIRLWEKDFPNVDIADVVIEAFACDIPDSYVSNMAAKTIKPRWLNLEYLSAEDWVAGCHQLPSPHPRLPLVKHFFFPGFTANTGGLIREHDLIYRRDAFQNTAKSQAEFWTKLGIPSPVDMFKISLFGYENPALPALLTAWANNTTPISVFLPESLISPQVHDFFGIGSHWQRGNLTVHKLPFLDQDNYDQLLWACDLNFVRGEDSFVRALWAGKPLVWHIYPQADNAHHAKLNAFLALYQQGLNHNDAAQLSAFWRAWNQMDSDVLDWPSWFAVYPQIHHHHAAWVTELATQSDLAASLVVPFTARSSQPSPKH